MRTLWPNLDQENTLETILEIPIPEEMFASNRHESWQRIKSWLIRPPVERNSSIYRRRAMEIQFLLGVIGAPLIPSPISTDRTFSDHISKDLPIESSMAKYIVQQYMAAAGGEHALSSIESMCAVGKVKMASSEFVAGDSNNTKVTKTKNMKKCGIGELGGFVLWQKKPDLWNLELMVSGVRICAGSDGEVAWRQTPWQLSQASDGPPRPLRRSLQGLDPRSTANVFSNSVCTGEKTINGQDCFVLKLEAEPCARSERSSTNVQVIRHIIWGSFSQKTGLLVQLEDSHLLRIGDDVFWETKTESWIEDYRTIDGVNIAHAGRTTVTLYMFGESWKNQTRTRIEEVWSIEEVDFNVRGLSWDCFLPPADLTNEDDCQWCYEECNPVIGNGVTTSGRFGCKFLGNSTRICAANSGNKVAATDEE